MRTAHGATLCADLVVVAAAGDTRTLGPTAALPLKPIRGQLTFVDANAASGALRTVVCGESYVAPARAGRHCIGATFDVADDAVDLRPDDHRRNLDRLAQLVPVLHAAFDGDRVDPATLGGRASVRWVTPDYLPLAGAVCDSAVFARRYAALARDATTHFDDVAPWLPGLYVTTGHGSRGLVTAPLLGEVIAALAFDEPAPLPVDVMRALAPTRFDARRLARSGRPPQPS
ncbi:MAG: FAD-dependent 5-carboxymethylaminomethyl-2-thiouridine(34) oxidoreductase MnmC [Burkholderiales bacterium]|nr:FAD-dependent 5-carboxymethylaminomethyl-2-thiouridine(34) oxidoreductase MnmC [Burkholderiales bacterium]